MEVTPGEVSFMLGLLTRCLTQGPSVNYCFMTQRQFKNPLTDSQQFVMIEGGFYKDQS